MTPALVTDERSPLGRADLLLLVRLPLDSDVHLLGLRRRRQRHREFQHPVMVLRLNVLGLHSLRDGEAAGEAPILALTIGV